MFMPKKHPPISHEKCPKVHDMWVKSVAAHPPFLGPFSCHFIIGYKNIPVSIDDAPKAVQGERNVVTTISARSAQRI